MIGLDRLRPTAAEATQLRFSFGSWSVDRRLIAAGGLFVFGTAAWSLLPLPAAGIGLLLVAAGHAVLWVRTQTIAPGGATPRHEEIWVPVEEGWLDRVREHEERGAAWDASPFDLTSLRGFAILFGIVLVTVAISVGALAVLGAALGSWAGFSVASRFGVGAAALLVPLWVSGIRTTWNPSELEKKGEALDAALRSFHRAQREAGTDDFDAVPMLALREGRRGKYPVDAKLMLRPATDDDSGFLGIQVQVAMNSVQGTDYPYLYAVVLGKAGFRPPEPGRIPPARTDAREMVFETGSDGEVRFLVIRQHADRSGGWHTEEAAIDPIVRKALELGRQAWGANRP